MPIYEYVCGKCQSEFELLVRGDTPQRCPQCNSTQLEKQWSVPATVQSESANCELPLRGGGCGLPQCGTGCQFD